MCGSSAGLSLLLPPCSVAAARAPWPPALCLCAERFPQLESLPYTDIRGIRVGLYGFTFYIWIPDPLLDHSSTRCAVWFELYLVPNAYCCPSAIYLEVHPASVDLSHGRHAVPPSRLSVLSGRASPLESPAAVGLPAALPVPTSTSTSARATLCFKKVGVFTGTAQNPFRTQGDWKPLGSGVVLPRNGGSLSAGSAAAVGRQVHVHLTELFLQPSQHKSNPDNIETDACGHVPVKLPSQER